jgi:cytochrome c553
MKKGSRILIGFITLVALATWAPNVSAFGGFDDGGGAGLPPCAACHPALANFGPGHSAHAALSNNDCNSCHVNSGGPGNNNPPLANCVRCHGRDADGAPSADFSPGLGRGLRQHHVTVGVAACGNCHQDTVNATTGSAPENVLPSFYPLALGGAGLDPCDGSEETFPSNSVSLDNDGDGLTDGADPDCAPAVHLRAGGVGL